MALKNCLRVSQRKGNLMNEVEGKRNILDSGDRHGNERHGNEKQHGINWTIEAV